MAPKTEAPTEEVESDDAKVEKPKRPRTPAQIEAFNKAREALKKKIEDKQKVKEDEDKIKKIEKLTKRVESIKKEIVKPPEPKADVVSRRGHSPSPELSDEEADDEEEIVVIKKHHKPKPPPKKKKIIVVESESESEESSEEEEVIQKPKPRSKPIAIPKPDIKPKGGISFF